MVVCLNWKFVFIGFLLVGLSAFVQAAYNPYINNGYGRPYYTQFHALPGVPREAQIYYGTNVQGFGYSNGWESYSEVAVQNPYYGAVYTGSPYYYYRSPAAFVAPTYTVYTPPVIPVVQTTIVTAVPVRRTSFFGNFKVFFSG